MTKRHCMRALAAALAAAALSACAAHNAEPQVSVRQGPRPARIAPYAGQVMPLDAYAPSGAQMTQLLQGRRTLQLQCMHRLGFSGDDFAHLAFAGFDEDVKAQHLIPLDAAVARYSGYHQPDDEPLPPPPPHFKPVSALEYRDQLQAMSGTVARVHGHTVPPGGCEAQADRELYQGTPGALSLDPLMAEDESQISALSDRRVMTVFAAWSQCMKQSGFRFPDPMTAVDGTAGHASMDGYYHTLPKPSEIKVAEADAACRQRESVQRVWNAVVADYQRREIATNHTELEAARQQFARWLATARNAVATG